MTIGCYNRYSRYNRYNRIIADNAEIHLKNKAYRDNYNYYNYYNYYNGYYSYELAIDLFLAVAKMMMPAMIKQRPRH